MTSSSQDLEARMNEMAHNDPLVPTLEGNLKTYFDRQQEAVFIYDIFQVKFVYGNNAALKAFGHSTYDSFVHKTLKETSQTTIDTAQNIVLSYLSSHEPTLRRWTFYPEGKTPFVAVIRSTAIIVNNSVCELVEVLQRDTDTKNNGKLMAEAFKFSPGLISIFNATDGSSLLHNLRAADVYKSKITTTKNLLKSTFKASGKIYEKIKNLCVGQSFTDPQVLMGEKKKKKVYHHISVSCQKNPLSGSNMYIIHQADVSSHVSLQMQLQAIQKQKTNSDLILQAAASDLGPKLSGIIGLSATLVDDPTLTGPDSVAHIADMIKNSGTQLIRQLQVINGYSSLNRSTSSSGIVKDVELQVLNIKETLARVVKDAQASIKSRSNLRIVNKIDPTLDCNADSRLLKMACHCLLNNAIKYTPSGTITINAEEIEGGITKIFVTDTGIGIAPEDFTRIFNLFEQAEVGSSRDEVGKGIGLALVSKIAKIFGGETKVESSVIGEGSCVSISINNNGRMSRTSSAHSIETEEGSTVEDNNSQNKQELEALRDANDELKKQLEEAHAMAAAVEKDCNSGLIEKLLVEKEREIDSLQSELEQSKIIIKTSDLPKNVVVLQKELAKSKQHVDQLKLMETKLKNRIRSLALVGIDLNSGIVI